MTTETKLEERQESLVCTRCGHTGTDVGHLHLHIGGQDYVDFPECLDQVACDTRLGEAKAKLRQR